jgi:hypothetical protein
MLIGSSDFNSHSVENHLLGLGSNATNIGSFSTQRLLDMSYAHNDTLASLIGQLSSNVTLSLFTDPIVAPLAPTNVAVTSPINIYSFQSHDVLLAYCLVGAVVIIASVLGGYAYLASGESYDVSFSSIVFATHNVHFSTLRVPAHERLGALPLDDAIAHTELRFSDGTGGRWGFGVEN